MNLPLVPHDASTLPRAPEIDKTSGTAFEQLLKKHKLSHEEYRCIEGIIGRAPTLAELGSFSAMWSEHCSYKSSRIHLGRFPTEGPHVVVGPGENAGVVRLSGKLCLAFKMESHNHPSYIEPYQGAATGVGGILRDVFCMGARPIANLNALRFGERSHPRTQHLLEQVVKGIGDYGNCVGIPTVGGNISFDRSYNGNCLVNAMTVGVIHEDQIFKGYASGQGNLVVYLGSATGRDGIHGASMASGSFATATSGERSTVQVGDPFTEKLLLEATLDVLERGLVVGLQDMGAAGLTSSAFEMAGRAGNGLYLDLDAVPVRTEAMSAYELLLSESQERMLMVIEPARWGELERVLEKWQLACRVIGIVTGTGRVQIHYQGRLEVDVPVAPMTDAAPRYDRPRKQRPSASVSAVADFNAQVEAALETKGLELMLHELLTWSGSGDKSAIYQQYDHHIGTKTVFGSEQQGAAVLWLRSVWAQQNTPYLGVALATACNERLNRVDAKLGAAHAVTKAARMIAAVGGEPLAITDCLNYGNPEDPLVMADFSAGVDGISEACKELNVPVVSGNVSLYNETDGESIAPTPMIGMVGRIADVRLCPPAIFSEPGALYLLSPKSLEVQFGGSLLAQVLGLPERGGACPPLNWEVERQAIGFLRSHMMAGKLAAARDVGAGGLLLTALKMGFGSQPLPQFGLELNLEQLELSPLKLLFAEFNGSYLLMFKAEPIPADIEEFGRRWNQLRLTKIGKVTSSAVLSVGGGRIGHFGQMSVSMSKSMTMAELRISYQHALPL